MSAVGALVLKLMVTSALFKYYDTIYIVGILELCNTSQHAKQTLNIIEIPFNGTFA